MKMNLLKLPGLLLAVVLLATCTEQPTMAPDNEVEAVTSPLSSVVACDLVKQMEAEVRDYFKKGSNSVRQATSTSMRQLGTACGAGDETGIETHSVFLLKEMETAVKTGYGGAASLGASLARNLIACNTVEGCSIRADAISDPFALPSLADLQKALGEATGTFAVRATGETAAAVARARIAFKHVSEVYAEDNEALFGAQLGPNTTWVIANQNPATQPFVVIYGFRTGSGNVSEDVHEKVVGSNLGYTFNRWPDMERFKSDGLVHVGVCFAEPIGFPHGTDTPNEAKGRMQREGVALFWFTPTFDAFCLRHTTTPDYASILGPVKTFALSLMPRSWAAMFMGDIRTPVIGGGSIDWSEFAPAGLNTQGTLTLKDKPNDRAEFQVNDPVINFTVEARSGGGTPMEVPVEIYVAGNSGEPANAIIGPEPRIKFTSEDNGIVQFNDMFLGKPGGYTICVRANVPGFTFTEACTGLIFAKQ